jgi:hypothetical protein
MDDKIGHIMNTREMVAESNRIEGRCRKASYPIEIQLGYPMPSKYRHASKLAIEKARHRG